MPRSKAVTRQRDPLPDNFDSLGEFEAFWDAHSTADYEDLMEEEAVADDEFKLPPSLHERLQELLDRQDQGTELTPAERTEAEELVNLAERLSLQRLRAQRTGKADSLKRI